MKKIIEEASNEEILKKAIGKAINNGYKTGFIYYENGIKPTTGKIAFIHNFTTTFQIESGVYKAIIFSHEFAKAFWKDGQTYSIINNPTFKGYTAKRQAYLKKNSWMYFLKNMVLEENPIKYLAKFI